MRKFQIQQSAHEVATQVRAVEDSIEAALMELAELQSRLLRARAVAGVGIATGHQALTEVASALQGLVSARGDMAAAHASLVEAKNQVPGLRTVGFGDLGECPEASARADLRVVA
jgi:dGTP triphosphohydrolase